VALPNVLAMRVLDNSTPALESYPEQAVLLSQSGVKSFGEWLCLVSGYFYCKSYH
jgi:hypothetical protein